MYLSSCDHQNQNNHHAVNDDKSLIGNRTYLSPIDPIKHIVCSNRTKMMTPIKTILIMVIIIHPIQCSSNHGNAGVPHFDRPRFGSIDRDKRQSNFTLSDLDNDYNFSTTATFFENSTATTIHSFTNLIPIDDNFQPLFKGRIIPKNELNLTDKAKKVMTELDYYDQDDYGDDEDYDEDDNITSTESPNTNNVTDNQDDDDDDIDKAIGGVAGILDKLIRGPKQKEINGKSRPEDVYIYLSRIIQHEYAKSIKAIMPRVYDYQFVIGERISQRCFNSFVQFANQFRRHSIWPYQSMYFILSNQSSFFLVHSDCSISNLFIFE